MDQTRRVISKELKIAMLVEMVGTILRMIVPMEMMQTVAIRWLELRKMTKERQITKNMGAMPSMLARLPLNANTPL